MSNGFKDVYKVNIPPEVQAGFFTRQEKERIYMNFVAEQEQGFMEIVKYIYNVVDLLKQQAKISTFIEIRARIKSINSAIKNDDTDNKALDDVFGVEIICLKEEEIDVIRKELAKFFISIKSKTHDKPNGYKAKHESYCVKQEISVFESLGLDKNNIPITECQYKTMHVATNPTAVHYAYKGVNEEEIIARLKKETLQIGRDIPRMWVSRESGIIELSYKEIIQKIYPFVDITIIKEPEQQLPNK